MATRCRRRSNNRCQRVRGKERSINRWSLQVLTWILTIVNTYLHLHVIWHPLQPCCVGKVLLAIRVLPSCSIFQTCMKRGVCSEGYKSFCHLLYHVWLYWFVWVAVFWKLSIMACCILFCKYGELAKKSFFGYLLEEVNTFKVTQLWGKMKTGYLSILSISSAIYSLFAQSAICEESLELKVE